MHSHKKMRKKLFKIKYKPSAFILYGLIFYFFVLLINPFNYTVYSLEGVLYFILSYMFLFLGAYITEKLKSSKSIHKKIIYEVSISSSAERFIQLISILAIIFFIIYYNDVTSLVVGDYEFANEDLRLALSNNRTFANRISEIGMQIGPVAYLVSSNVTKLNYRYTKILSMIAFWVPSIGILAIGARGIAVIGLFIFVINNLLQKKNRIETFSIQKIIKKISPYIISFLLIYIIYGIFVSRPGISTTEDLYLIYPGDITIKPLYQDLNKSLNYKLDPLYKLFMYYTHSFPTFTYFFINSPVYGVFWGVLQFSFIFIVLNTLGIVNFSPNFVGLYNPTKGLYSTFISYFILDFGRILGLAAILLSGIFFGLIYRSYKKGKIGYFIFPLILTMSLISPVYYFWTVGRIDVILVWYIILYPIIKLLGLRTIEVDYEE